MYIPNSDYFFDNVSLNRREICVALRSWCLMLLGTKYLVVFGEYLREKCEQNCRAAFRCHPFGSRLYVALAFDLIYWVLLKYRGGQQFHRRHQNGRDTQSIREACGDRRSVAEHHIFSIRPTAEISSFHL